MTKRLKKPKTTRVPKTRNAGTMTESQFWSMIRSALRQKSRWWTPIKNCKNLNRREYKGKNKRQKYEYQCNHCKEWFPEKQISADHIIPCGQLNCAEDLPGFVNRLFVEISGFQILCDKCHTVKTNLERSE